MSVAAGEPDGPPAGPSRSLVVPMFREAGRITRAVGRLTGSELEDPDVELLFVDDGSDDGTAEVLEEALAGTRLAASLLRLEVNSGKGAAVRAGVLKSRGQVVAFTDADLSTPPEDVVRAFRLIESGDADIVVGSRTHRSSTIPVPQPVLRQLAGKMFNLVLRLLRLAWISDTQCGLKAFTYESAVRLFSDLQTVGFAFDVEVLLRGRQIGLRVVEMPVRWSHIEDSRVRAFRDSLHMLMDVARVRSRVRSRR